MQRENRYIVIKRTDLENVELAGLLRPSEIDSLKSLLETIARVRLIEGKQPLQCVVVESDWPEYEPTWNAIEARVNGNRGDMTISTEMTLEQAIKHAKNQADALAGTPCGEQHAQLSGWLTELLAVREAKGTTVTTEPFMFAICNPDGTAWLDENCVANTAENLKPVLNDLRRDTGDVYRIIPLFTASPAPAYPEKLPCPVYLVPELRFGKGISTHTLLEALARREEYYADIEAMTAEEREKHYAASNAFKAILPAPVTQEDQLINMANHIAGSANGLPNEWQDWASELVSDLHRLATLRTTPVVPGDAEFNAWVQRDYNREVTLSCPVNLGIAKSAWQGCCTAILEGQKG